MAKSLMLQNDPFPLQIDNSPKHKQILTKCIEDGQKTKERLKKFKEGLSHTTLKMVSVSPPMVLHIDKNESNSLLLEEPVTPPLHWIRPIIMKSYLGTPLVKGLAKDKGNILILSNIIVISTVSSLFYSLMCLSF